MSVAAIFARTNRGTLLDVLTFLLNLLFMRLLVGIFSDLFRQASSGKLLAKTLVVLVYLALLVLPSVAAVLKRWPRHQLAKLRGEDEDSSFWLFGCLIIPAIYLAVNMWISLAVSLAVLDLVADSEFGKRLSWAFLVFGLVASIVQTVLVFRYFVPPKHEPRFAFLRDPRCEILGDVCVFVNAILFQALLNYEASVYFLFHEGSFVDRFIPLVVFVLLVYLASRILFLADDIRRPRTLLTILLANSVLVIRTIFA